MTEHSLLTLTAVAIDVDGTNDVLTYRLDTLLTDAVVDPITGIFSWVPTEVEGPGTNLISIVVSDSGTPSLSTTQSFTAVVFETNSAPVLAAISDRTIYAENPFSFTNIATDSDIPANTLVFSLPANSPVGATINSSNGVFSWTSPADEEPGVNLVSIAVSDNGSPSLSATQSFVLTTIKLPLDFSRTLAFGTRCAADFTNTLSISVTNSATNIMTLGAAFIKGADAADFHVISDSGQTNLSSGEVRQIEIGFTPQTLGNKQATLEIVANENETLGDFLLNVTLTGSFLDNEVQISTPTLNFGATSIDSLNFITNTLVITNNGSTNLKVLSVVLSGLHPNDFKIASDTGETNLASGATRTVHIAFAPQRRGEKFAILRIESLACAGAFEEIFMAGTATSAFDHFSWNPISSPQLPNVPFATQVTAQDRNGDTIENFSGTASLSAVTGDGPSTQPVLISEINTGNPDGVEFVNVSSFPVDVSGWRIVVYDPSPTVRSTTIIPANSILAPNGIFRITESGTAPGTFPNLSAGTTFGWVGGSTAVSVLLQNPQGAIVDFATLGSSASIISPLTIPTNEWSGAGITAGAIDDSTSYQRRGTNDSNNNANWVIASLSFGLNNVGLTVPFPGVPRSVLLHPTNLINFSSGVWSGNITVNEEVLGVRLTANDAEGHIGRSNPFDVRGTGPSISDVLDLAVDEDTATTTLPLPCLTVETPAYEFGCHGVFLQSGACSQHKYFSHQQLD